MKTKLTLTAVQRRIVSLSLLGLLIVLFSGLGLRSSTPNQVKVVAEAVADAAPSDVLLPAEVRSLLEVAPLSPADNRVRKFPFPYRAMLALSSDIDMTTLKEFEDYHRFLNTKEQTPNGKGVGLDIGDSAWLYVSSDVKDSIDPEGHSINHSMSYFHGTDGSAKKDAEKILHYYRAGWIDSLHSFGDFSRNDKKITFSRDLALKAWQAMNESGFKPSVWINHGSPSNAQNFGGHQKTNPYFNYQAGDDPKSSSYHTDLTLTNGIRYVWNSAGMSQFAYDNPLFPLKLRDGRQVWGFYRYTHDLIKNKISWTWETPLLPQQLTPIRLDSLVNDQKYSIVTQHLGKGSSGFPFTPASIQALRQLEAYQNKGKILVARTERLLNYARTLKSIRYTTVEVKSKTYINIAALDDPVLGKSLPTLAEIRGLTFYVADPTHTLLLLNYQPIAEEDVQRNLADANGRQSIGIAWFKPDFTDYTQTP